MHTCLARLSGFFRTRVRTERATWSGAPLRVETSAEKRKPQDWVLQRQGTTAVDPKVDSDFVLAISAQIQGVGKETYAWFRLGRDFKQLPPKPAFTVADAQGQVVGSGNLEFG
jgi:hypothetical protein